MLGKTLVRCYKIDENADVPVPDLGQTGYNERAIGINMRLTCPNCSARYEVADSMVPPEGRDVQCSNCSTTWFQPGRRTDVEPAIAPKRGDATPPPAPPAGDAEAEPEQPADTPPGIENVIEAAAGAAAGTGPRRQEMEPGIRDILREEAERETRLRQAEAGSVETQSEMPLDEGQAPSSGPGRGPGLADAQDAFSPAPQTPDAAQARRDLFPDIDEINSTLRDTGDRSGEEDTATDIDTVDTIPRRRRGVRLGFFFVVLIALSGLTLYTNPDEISATMPIMAGAIEGYVAAIDSARFWLDGIARGLGASADG